MSDKEIKFVPARYVGQNRIRLHSPARNADGSRRTTLDLSPGDVILMPEYEVAGYTLLFDPQGNNAPRDLGAGRRILPEHLEFKDDERELSVRGYEFHGGRTDFELVEETLVAPGEPEQTKGGKA
ncbi:MAG: hypothetical protein PVSMB5_19980 [Ktedonobacteraceae bacterium]